MSERRFFVSAQHTVSQYVQSILDAAPALSDEKRDRITTLLNAAGDAR